METRNSKSLRRDLLAMSQCIGAAWLFMAFLPAQQDEASPFVRASALLLPVRHGEPYLATPDFLNGRRMAGGIQPGTGYPEHDPHLEDSIASPLLSMDALASILQELGTIDAGKLHALQGGELLLVRAEDAAVVTKLCREIEAAMPPLVTCEFEVTLRSKDASRVVLRREVVARSGQVAWGSAVEDSVAVTDFEVEISQEATAGNPVVQRLLHGAMVRVRPLVVPGEPRSFFEVLLRIVDRGDEGLVELGETTSGSLDRAHQRVRELGVVLSARVGETVTHRFSGLDGNTVELRMTPRFAVAPAIAKVGGRDFEYAPPWIDYRGFRSYDLDSVQALDLVQLQPDTLSFSESLERSSVAFWKAGSGDAAVAVGDAATQLRLFQRSRHADLKPVTVRVIAYDAQEGQELAADGTLPSARRLASAEVATVLGSWTAATSYEEFSIVADWDVEVAQGSRIGDPKVRRRAVGAALNIRCSDAGVEIEGELSTRGPIESRQVRIGQGKYATPDAKSSASVTYVVPPEVVTIESVRRTRQPLQIRLPLRSEQPAVYRATTTFLPQGRQLVVTAQRVDG